MMIRGRNRGVANIGGVDFNLIKTANVPQIIAGWKEDKKRGCINLVNPHAVMLCRRDARMRQATEMADLNLADGVGIIVGAWMLGQGRHHRVTGPNLMLHICAAGRELGLRHYFYGGREGVAERLAERLEERFPGMRVAGTYCPPFRPLDAAETTEIAARINATSPDVIWVGLGAPKQEKWMADHIHRFNASALIGVGAAFDFHSGNVPWAPQWVRAIGCEWAYRLMIEPRRMWRRNLDSPLFLGCVALQAAGLAGARLWRSLAPALAWVFSDDRSEGGGGNGAAHADGASFDQAPLKAPSGLPGQAA